MPRQSCMGKPLFFVCRALWRPMAPSSRQKSHRTAEESRTNLIFMQKCRHIFQFKICRNNDIFLPFTVSTSHLIQYSLCIVRHCWFPQKCYPVINIITLFAIVSQCQYFIAIVIFPYSYRGIWKVDANWTDLMRASSSNLMY